MTTNYQKAIYNIFGGRTIAYNAVFAEILGSVKAGLLLSQFLYWDGKGHDKDWFYKTADDLEDETSLSRAEQDSAIKICKKFGILETKLAGIPATRHFRINKEKIIELISSLSKSGKLDLSKYAKRSVKKRERNTYSSHNKTTEIENAINNLGKAKTIKNSYN